MPHEAGQPILAAVVGLLIIIAADSFKRRAGSMDLSGWIPPEIAIGCGLIVLLGGSWVVYGLWILFQHVSIGWH